MKDVSKPVLHYLSLLEIENTFAVVPDEMLINIHEPVIDSKINKSDNNEIITHHLSTTQQEDLMRKFILQEKSYTYKTVDIVESWSNASTLVCGPKYMSIVTYVLLYQKYKR